MNWNYFNQERGEKKKKNVTITSKTSSWVFWFTSASKTSYCICTNCIWMTPSMICWTFINIYFSFLFIYQLQNKYNRNKIKIKNQTLTKSPISWISCFTCTIKNSLNISTCCISMTIMSTQSTFIYIFFWNYDCYFICYFILYFEKIILPRQFIPFPEYPSLQVQFRLPIVFSHFAFISHPPLFVKHSSISIKLKFHILLFWWS